MPRTRKPRPTAAQISPAPPAAEGETPSETAEAGVRAAEEGGRGKEMEVEPAVDERGEVEPEEATGVEPDEEAEEDPDEEEAEEDPEEEEEGADEGEGNEEEAVLAVGPGDGTAAAAETEKVVIKEGGDEDTGMEPAKKEGPEEAVEEDEEPEEAGEEEEEEEEPVEAEVGAKEDEGMEEEATKVLAEGATANVSEGIDKELEIFVGGLPKDCVEEDITMVFSQFGEIESIRIIRNQATNKSRGIAFLRYANTEAARKAIAEFEGIEVKGKRVRVSASQDSNTLYLGNICKSWTKDQVLDTLKNIGIEEFEISLPDDHTGGRNRGFAFLKFAAHDNAEAAFQRLKRPDAIFGIDKSAKVSFARPPTKPSEELLMKVKTVYLEHVPLSWDEKKVEECCGGYGKIQNVHLFHKFKKSKKKIAFVEFSTRKSALACVEGVNNTKIGGGEVKLVASLARPPCKIQLAENSAKGGFKVNSGATSKAADKSKKKKDQKREVVVKKNSPHKLPKVDESKLTSQGDAELPQTSNRSKGKRKAGKGKNTSVNERPSKKARKNRDVLRRPSNITHLGGSARAAYAGQSAGNMMHPAGPRYATSYQSYPSAGAASRSKPNARDLEPHAGYIPLANRVPSSRVQSTYVNDQQRTAPYNIHQINGLPYAREAAAPQPAYSVYTSNPGYQGGYAYTYLPPLPPPSGSYHPGSGADNPRRGYY